MQQQHISEKVICISKDGSRIGYKKTRREKITNLDHIFNIIRPSRPKQITKFSYEDEQNEDTECAICCSGFDDTGKYTSKCVISDTLFHGIKHISCQFVALMILPSL